MKKAYYKVSLKVHPDKVARKDTAIATGKFQMLSMLFKILSDTKKRQVYDKTGKALAALYCMFNNNYIFSILLP